MPADKYFFGAIGNDRGATALHGTDSSNFVDHIYCLDGSDELFGYRGTDFMYGGDGDDRFDAGSGIDFIYGGNGFDTAARASTRSGAMRAPTASSRWTST